MQSLLEYWTTQLAGFETLSLPTDFVRPPVPDNRGEDFVFAIEQDLSDQLRQLTQAQGVTLHNLMLSGLYITLATLCGQQDIVIGIASENRDSEQTRAMLGVVCQFIGPAGAVV